MKALAAITLSAIILAGCETLSPPESPPPPTYAERQATYEKALTSWDGADVNLLIAQSGPPTSTFNMPNGNVLYTYSRGAYISSVPVTCTRNFVVDNSTGRIVGHSYSGNICF